MAVASEPTSIASLVNGQVREYWPAQADTAAVMVSVLLLWLLWRRRRGLGIAGTERPTDVLYWVISPAVRLLSRVTVVGVVLLPAAAVGLDLLPSWLHGHGPVARQPRALMLVELIVLTDLASYWSHRLLHRVPALWRFHAVHHSATQVTWSTTARMHPINDVITYAFNVLPALVVGFPAEMLAPLLPFIMWYAIYLHCPLNVDHGPLSRVLSSPRFHRFHHTARDQGGDRNFAGLFAFWDLLFGTLYLPRDRRPERFGTDASDVPARMVGQLCYPFRNASPGSQGSVAAGACSTPSSSHDDCPLRGPRES